MRYAVVREEYWGIKDTRMEGGRGYRLSVGIAALIDLVLGGCVNMDRGVGMEAHIGVGQDGTGEEG